MRRRLRHLAPYADQIALTRHIPPVWGSVDFFLGELAATLGRSTGAERHLRAAATASQRLGAHRWLARTWRARGRQYGTQLHSARSAPG